MPSKLSIAIGQARGYLPLPRLAQSIGLSSAALEKKAECPFCHDKTGKFSIYRDSAGRWFFKCHNQKPDPCKGGVNDCGHNEIAFLQLIKGWDEKTAIKEFIRLAEDISNTKLYDFDFEDRKPSEPEAPSVPFYARSPWDALYHSMILNARDADILRTKRGFDERTIKSLGFKTNNRANAARVEAVADEDRWSREQLLSLGILKVRRNRPEPNNQLVGLGITKEKDEDGEPIWDWVEPIIIPYLDTDGHAFYLRPHKGGLKQERDEFDEDFTSSHVYCPFLLSDFTSTFDGTVIITEGEFKAAAAWQARVPCLAIPGISFGKNKAFRKELVDLLRKIQATNVVIIFDNEIKGDPRFKDRFKPDPYDREDTIVWAMYLARDLKDDFESVTVGKLPDEWLIEGKADIDGALAAFVHGVKDHPVFALKNGYEEGSKLLRRGLLQAIDASEKPDAFLKALPAARRNIIKNKLERRWNPPELKSGGDHEEKMTRRFLRLDHEGNPIDEQLAHAFRKVHGCYYTRKRPSKDDAKLYSIRINSLDRQIAVYGAMPAQEKDDIPGVGVEEIDGLTKEERAELGPTLSQLRDERAALYERLKGMPHAITDCTLRCDYKKHGSDGQVVRLVRIKNCRSGKWSDRLYDLNAASSCAPKNFREWGLGTGQCVWSGNQEELDTMMLDLDNSVEGRNIFEINAYGHSKASGLWFFGDCAFSPEGHILEADASNIIWHEGMGYQVDPSVEDRGTSFEQRAPLMLCAQETAANAAKNPTDILHAMCGDLLEIIGDYDAWIFIGNLASYAIAPELIKYYGGHPGAWLYGVRGGGKTTIARWGMRIWGFGHLDGIAIDDRTTPVGMNRTLSQYSNLPVWFEEYRHSTVTPQKEAVLRGAFDRNSGAKGMPDGSNRTKSAKVFTTPIVTGESSSSDAATRSRYTQFNIAKSRRKPGAENSYSRIQQDCKHYYLIGKYILEHREEFWKLCEPEIRKWWEDNDAVKKQVADERVRYVYAVARASFLALAKMLDVRHDELDYFDNACIHYAEIALQDVVDETFVNQFWSDVVSGLRTNEIELDLFEEAVVKINEDGSLSKAAGAVQGAEWTEILYVAAKPIFDQYAVYVRKQGRTPKNELADMRRDIAREKYWLPPPSNSSRAHATRIKGATTKVWALIAEAEHENCFPWAGEIRELLEHRRGRQAKSGVTGVE